jgi:Fic/DOC family
MGGSPAPFSPGSRYPRLEQHRGLPVAEDDAAAALDGEEPISADEETSLEMQGYRQALVYVLAMGAVEYATFDAMAHLNLVMIHPFRDGNGRMARALATLVLTRSDIGEPEFSSIEEWLGANTDDYYRVLAHTGHGSWPPRDDAHLWLAFNLRAHHMQAQTVARRVEEAGITWTELDALRAEHDLPERAMEAIFDAVLGYRVRRAGYLKRAQVTEQTATRDLAALASAGILSASGNGRGGYSPEAPSAMFSCRGCGRRRLRCAGR